MRSLYYQFSIILTNAVILFAIVNLAIWPFIRSTPEPKLRSRNVLKPLSCHRDRAVNQAFEDFLSQPTVFLPFLRVGEPPFSSPILTIKKHPDGFTFRSQNQRELSAANAFVFGNQRVGGYYLSDQQTITSRISEQLKRVGKRYEFMNFAGLDYSGNDHLTLFQRLLHSGHTPKIAIFIDSNPTKARDESLDLMAKTWEFIQFERTIFEYIEILPIFTLVNQFKNKHEAEWIAENIRGRYPLKEISARKDNYLASIKSRRAIGNAFEVRTFFFREPTTDECERGIHSQSNFSTVPYLKSLCIKQRSTTAVLCPDEANGVAQEVATAIQRYL